MSIEFKPASFKFSPKTSVLNSSKATDYENKQTSSSSTINFKPASFKFSPKSSSSSNSQNDRNNDISSSTIPSGTENVQSKEIDNKLKSKVGPLNLTGLNKNNTKTTGVKTMSSISQPSHDSSKPKEGIISALLDVDINTPNKDLKALHGIGGLKSQSASATLMELKRLEKLKEEELAYFLNNPSLLENRNTTQQALYINQNYEHLMPQGLLKEKKNPFMGNNYKNNLNTEAVSAHEALLSHHQHDMERNHQDHRRISALQKKMGKNIKRSKAQQKLKQKAKGSSYNDKLEHKKSNIRSSKRKR